MIASPLFALAWRRFRRACRDPLAAQARCLRRILHDARGTVAGRRHGFAALSRIGDGAALVRAFQDAVPIRTYGAMRDDLDAVYAGDWRRLCPSAPVHFAMTAGSTGAFKYIPVTREFRRELDRGSMVFNGALEACCPEARDLKAQFLAGSAEGGRSPGGVPQGFASGFNYRAFPWLIRRRFAVPYWVFTLDDARERAYAAGRILVAERRLGVLAAITPLNLLNLREALERNAERLVEDVAAGTLTPRGSSALAGHWRTGPDRALAIELQAARRASGAFPTPLLFPSLRLLVSFQGGGMRYYLDDLETAFGRLPTLEFPISASEGVFGIPYRAGGEGGIVAVTSHLLEFVPEDGGARAHGRTDARACRADELVEGACYRVVVTNGGGLYRYDMEDIVRVTGFVERTPVIAFVSKTARRVSVANERLTEEDVTIAMQGASRACGIRFPAFLFVPCSDRRYRVIVDGAALATLGGASRASLLAALTAELERHLRSAATGYDFEREDALLEPLRVVVTAPGALMAWLDRRQAATTLPNAQAKPMHLATEFDLHRRFAEARPHAA